MWKDPIVEEVRQIREEHAAEFEYDLQAIYQDIKAQEIKSGRTFVSYPPRYCTPAAETEKQQNTPNKQLELERTR